MFSSRLPAVERFADLLARQGVLRGLIGPREVPRLWERHLVNCGLLATAVPDAADVCDVGSGAGLPGLVLALTRPDLRITLVEPQLRRTRFLDEAVSELGLPNVEVVRARAEQLHGERSFAVVTARAVAPLHRLADWTLPLVGPGGMLLAMKGASAAAEIDEARPVLRRHGATSVQAETYGAGIIDPPATVVRVSRRSDARRRGRGSAGRKER